MNLTGVQIWSAVPTPLTEQLSVDERSLARTIEASIQDGIHGLFLGGTCGEGPWLPDRERSRLVQVARGAAGRSLRIAAQVTDNSVPRILDNAARAAEAGADFAIIAPPAILLNATPERVLALFREAAERAPLPVGIYDLGSHRPIMIPDSGLQELYRLPNVRLVKDSSGQPARREQALAARKARPELHLFNGDEFRSVDYLEAGYNGMMFGGAIAVAPHLHRIAAQFAARDLAGARATAAEMVAILYGIYGGRDIACWLTGLKYYLVRRGLFSSTTSFLGYPLTETCARYIENYAAGQLAGK
jgi:4-hydroxy-tetrahydrodipicolinate synthase